MTSYPIKSPLEMSATLAINAKVREMLAKGRRVHHLGLGEARFPVHPKILTAFKNHASERSYLPTPGLPELRQAVADYYRRRFNIPATDRQVIIGSGSKSLLFAALQALKGDLLLPAPSWVSYKTQALLSGKAVHWIPTFLDDNYTLTPAQLKAGLKAARGTGQSPGVLVLNTPNNPTGVMYPPELLAELAEILRREKIVVLSDEIYALTAYGDIPHVSIAQYYPEGTIVTGGLSKHLSLGGWRLGVAILPVGEFGEALHRYMSSVAGAIWTTAAAPVQYAAVVAYDNDSEIDDYVAACTSIHGYVTNYLYDIAQDVGIPCPKPSGGFYLYPSFVPWKETLAARHNIHSSFDLANFLLDEESLATLPGSAFGADPQDLTLRLSTSYLYALSDEDAEAILAAYAKNLPPAQLLQETCPNVLAVGAQLKSFVGSLKPARS